MKIKGLLSLLFVIIFLTTNCKPENDEVESLNIEAFEQETRREVIEMMIQNTRKLVSTVLPLNELRGAKIKVITNLDSLSGEWKPIHLKDGALEVQNSNSFHFNRLFAPKDDKAKSVLISKITLEDNTFIGKSTLDNAIYKGRLKRLPIPEKGPKGEKGSKTRPRPKTFQVELDQRPVNGEKTTFSQILFILIDQKYLVIGQPAKDHQYVVLFSKCN